eukprot:GEMP01100186.1.p1 GENE.GEMP01100186.1~~GEMP01100186.1.p1  ORF type:complete len:144 (-),score=3.71 GEMP01100186.1:377-769(-)
MLYVYIICPHFCLRARVFQGPTPPFFAESRQSSLFSGGSRSGSPAPSAVCSYLLMHFTMAKTIKHPPSDSTRWRGSRFATKLSRRTIIANRATYRQGTNMKAAKSKDGKEAGNRTIYYKRGSPKNGQQLI